MHGVLPTPCHLPDVRVRNGYTLIIQRYMTYDSTQGTRADVR